jgi:hypothetical protein
MLAAWGSMVVFMEVALVLVRLVLEGVPPEGVPVVRVADAEAVDAEAAGVAGEEVDAVVVVDVVVAVVVAVVAKLILVYAIQFTSCILLGSSLGSECLIHPYFVYTIHVYLLYEYLNLCIGTAGDLFSLYCVIRVDKKNL